MTIFSGVVAILSPTLVSRLPTYMASDNKTPSSSSTTEGPRNALGAVLERMQKECGVACTRTQENVCMVQGEWEAVRKAYSFLDRHEALRKAMAAATCGDEAPATKKARRDDRSPEPDEPLMLASSASTPPISAQNRRKNNNNHPSPKPQPAARSYSPSVFPGAASPMAMMTERVGGVLDLALPPAAQSPPASMIKSRVAGSNTPQHSTSSPTPSSGRSGAGKRKQGIPRKAGPQVPQRVHQNFGNSDDESTSEMETEYDLAVGGSLPNLAQDSPPTFANGDSSIQIVATWGNYKEENAGCDLSMHPKSELASEDEENKSYLSDSDSKGPRMAGTAGVYTVQSDGQGGTVILPSVAEPVYVLNMSASTPDDYSGSESLTAAYNSENLYHSSLEKGDNKWALKKSSNGNIGVSSTAKKSTTPRISAKKSTTQRTILLVTKKAGQATTGGSPTTSPKAINKKSKGSASPQRRRGIIQGDSPIKGEYTCSYCQKVFNTKEAIKVHEEVYHTGRYKSMPSSSKSPLFECTQCGKSYMSKHALEEHLYTHVGMRPFACPFCAASFNHRKSLRRHVQLHNNVKRFDCPQCSKTFIRKDALESHLRIHKAEEEASGSDANVDMTATAAD